MLYIIKDSQCRSSYIIRYILSIIIIIIILIIIILIIIIIIIVIIIIVIIVIIIIIMICSLWLFQRKLMIKIICFVILKARLWLLVLNGLNYQALNLLLSLIIIQIFSYLHLPLLIILRIFLLIILNKLMINHFSHQNNKTNHFNSFCKFLFKCSLLLLMKIINMYFPKIINMKLTIIKIKSLCWLMIIILKSKNNYLKIGK